MEQVYRNWSSRDPAEAAQSAAALAEGLGRNELWRQIASSWGGSDPATALTWASQLPAGDGRAAAYSGALGSWAAVSPQEAAEYVVKLSGDELERGVKAVIGSMVGADASYTARWVQQFPEGKMREDASETLMRTWARQDPQAAATWMAALPEGASRDKAAENFVTAAAAHEPQLAWQWAFTLNNPTKQQEALETAAKQWLRINEKDARQAILGSGLPDNRVRNLLKAAP
jgi:hypothetical protein